VFRKSCSAFSESGLLSFGELSQWKELSIFVSHFNRIGHLTWPWLSWPLSDLDFMAGTIGQHYINLYGMPTLKDEWGSMSVNEKGGPERAIELPVIRKEKPSHSSIGKLRRPGFIMPRLLMDNCR